MKTTFFFENSKTGQSSNITRETLLDLVLKHFGDGGMTTKGTAKTMMIMSEIDSLKGGEKYFLTKHCSVTPS